MVAQSAASPNGVTSGPLLEVFRKSDFNVASFVRDATSQGQDRLRRLTQQLEDCASNLDEELQREIVACHEELLLSAGSVDQLDGQLGDVQEMVGTLKNSVARLRAEVMVPFADVKRKTILLERMQAASVLIRRLSRFLFDARKLRSQMEAPTKDYSKASYTLQELEAALAECALDRVDALRSEIGWIRTTGARVRRQAEDDLRNGTKQGNQIVLSTALQVFFNLQCLPKQVLKIIAELVEEFSAAQLVGGSHFQQSFDLNVQVLVAHAQRVYLLDDLIRSKIDPLTHRSFYSVFEEGEGGLRGASSLAGRYWADAAVALRTKFERLAGDRSTRRLLQPEFSQILSALTEAADKVNAAGRGKLPPLSAPDRENLCQVIAALRPRFND